MSSATTPTTVSTATMPTSMTDAEATRLGLKVYSHGTTYTGSPNSPTVTLFSGGGTLSSVPIADFIPYQMQDGGWRMKFNIGTTLSSQARTTLNLSTAGITFAAADQTVACDNAGAIAVSYALAIASTSQMQCGHASTTTNTANFSGDVKLASKPTWSF